MKDPAIEEIRRVRHEISAEFSTTEEFLDHYRDLEKQYASRILKEHRAPEPELRRS